jgi:Fic family protein
MSRFITSYLLSKELHPTLGLQVSILLKKNRKTYYTLFQEADSDINKGDLTPFIIGTLKFIYAAIIHTKTILQKKLNQYHYHKQNLSVFEINDSTTFKVYDILLQASVFSTWGITVDEMIHVIEKTESTIYSRLKAIPNDRIIISKNSRPYHYRLNLNSLKQK